MLVKSAQEVKDLGKIIQNSVSYFPLTDQSAAVLNTLQHVVKDMICSMD